jgi:hypothetical protein
VVPDNVKGVTDVLEEQAIGAGTVTTHGLYNMIKTVMGDVLGESGVPEVLELVRNHDQASNVHPPVHDLGDQPLLAHDIAFPNQSTLILQQL